MHNNVKSRSINYPLYRILNSFCCIDFTQETKKPKLSENDLIVWEDIPLTDAEPVPMSLEQAEEATSDEKDHMVVKCFDKIKMGCVCFEFLN